MERYPVRILWNNPETGYVETFVLVSSKDSFLVYMGEDSLREVLLTPDQALSAKRP